MFEKLATNAHFRISPDDLVKNQNHLIQQAMLLNNQQLLKSQLSNTLYLADTCKVILI